MNTENRRDDSTISSSRSTERWVASAPFFETVVFLQNLEQQSRASLCLHDCDGEVVNEVVVELEPWRQEVLELEHLLEGLKLEAGVKHGRMSLTTSGSLVQTTRLQNSQSACFLPEPMEISVERGGFFPITCSPALENTLVVLNPSADEVVLRSRLFIGRRMPEALLTIPAGGVRLLHLESEFFEEDAFTEQRKIRSYVRLTTKSEETLGVYLLQRMQGPGEKERFVCVS